MKAYLYGLSCLNGFMNINDSTREIYIALPEKLPRGFKEGCEVTKDANISKALFRYKGMMPVYEFEGID